ncbi:ferrous iron transport protein A [Siphonobacter sp. BAB-5385]|uniref:Ferrous iron transport protein A n=1 Tax=Siphonobacter curvatus TaxID=2094562 RepID=A0A2S7IMS2_9BACT|nr:MULTISPECIES: FeoA family protein [Siphonobacter]OZI08028.1 ferrous iron transport protein A [Siphonobacter sp. BAB-5385]PMD97004.1 ferrous iron transport protein A [Siphonobacter sp. BAB-5405]PQA59024.1 ferrous iron transport protein A [Siphonobacter curvatus]
MSQRNLSQLRIGEKGIIAGFKDTILALKLLEMGCLPGTEIRLTAIAPLGDPICLQVGDYILSLRLDEAAVVELQ